MFRTNKSNRRRRSHPSFSLFESLESRTLLAAIAEVDQYHELLWPAGGNNACTYQNHPTFPGGTSGQDTSIDIGQDEQRTGLVGRDIAKDDNGAPVFASHAGIAVVHRGNTGGYGNSVEVVIYDENGFNAADTNANRLSRTIYTHLKDDSIPEHLQTGSPVSQGQIIGRVGSTGVDGDGNPTSTGPHIHYELQSADGSPLSANGENVRYYKGMLKASPYYQLSEGGVPVGPEFLSPEDRSVASVALVRPNSPLYVNGKAFDWDEFVRYRICRCERKPD